VSLVTEVLEILLASTDTVTADDIHAALERRNIRLGEPRAIGAVIQSYMRRGILRPVRYERSRRPEAHYRAILRLKRA
jgi:Fe2+ or Zn2+ uptake regulation protein